MAAALDDALRNAFPDASLSGFVNMLPTTDEALGAMAGWTAFVAPYTPPHCFKLSTSDPMLDWISVLLATMISPEYTDQPSTVTIHPAIISLWPAIWIWLQALHEDSRIRSGPSYAARGVSVDPPSQKYRYKVLFKTLYCLIYQDPPTELSVAVAQTEGVKAMLARMWIDESTDADAYFGFQTTKLLARVLSDHNLSLPPTIQDLFEHIVAGYGSDPNAILKLVSRRLETNLQQRQPDYPNLHADLLFLGYHIRGHFDKIDTCRHLNATLINTARRLAIFLVKFLSLALQAQSRSATWELVVTSSLETITSMLQVVGSHSYEIIAALSATELFTVVAHPMLAGGTLASTMAVSNTLAELLQCMGRFAVYRHLLLKMNRSLIAAFAGAKIPEGPIGDVLRKFRTHIAERIQRKILYQVASRPCKILCGNPQCVSLGFERTMQRCSGCFIICYCSKTCQQRHWHGEHKKTCRDMGQSVKGRGSLSGPNLRFFASAILSDYITSDNLFSATRFPGGSLDPSPTGNPVLVLDYDNGPWKLIPQAEVVDFQSPTSITRKYSHRVPELQDLLQQFWSTYTELPHLVVPVLALVPRGWKGSEQDSQALAALIIVRRNPHEDAGDVPDQPRTFQCVRWLFYI